jgi:uncharacterized membrane protein
VVSRDKFCESETDTVSVGGKVASLSPLGRVVTFPLWNQEAPT